MPADTVAAVDGSLLLVSFLSQVELSHKGIPEKHCQLPLLAYTAKLLLVLPSAAAVD